MDALRFWNRFHDPGEMGVEAPPEIHELIPGGLSVFLHQNPSILVVSREYQVFLELRSHKAVVIAGRGIDQVTDGFLGRPLSGPERR